MSVEASAAMGCRAMGMDEGMCRRGIDYVVRGGLYGSK